MRTASPQQQIETCLMYLDDIAADRTDFTVMYAHRPEYLREQLAKLDAKFIEWQQRLTRLEKRTHP